MCAQNFKFFHSFWVIVKIMLKKIFFYSIATSQVLVVSLQKVNSINLLLHLIYVPNFSFLAKVNSEISAFNFADGRPSRSYTLHPYRTSVVTTKYTYINREKYIYNTWKDPSNIKNFFRNYTQHNKVHEYEFS